MCKIIIDFDANTRYLRLCCEMMELNTLKYFISSYSTILVNVLSYLKNEPSIRTTYFNT